MSRALADEFAGRRVTVMGLGRFSGGVTATRFLAGRGARVTVTDLRPAAELAESVAQLDGLDLERLRLGGHDAEDFQRAEMVVVSPAVRRDHPLLAVARASGAEITSEIRLFWQRHRGRTIAVTGSNGKSTTAAMIHAMLAAAGRTVRLGGNIGRSLLGEVEHIAPEDWTVLELSSFQLEDLDAIHAAPDVAVVTNFSPNHLDRHGTLAEYRRAKQSILRWQSKESVAVLNADDADVAAWPTPGRRYEFRTAGPVACGVAPPEHGAAGGSVFRWGDGTSSADLPLAEAVSLPGRHNLANAAAAACAALAAGVDVRDVLAGLRRFQPLPHRLQPVGEVGGRRFVNDSLATTPESALLALEAFREPLVLLAGGTDKGSDLGAFAAGIAGRVRAVALLGRTGPALAALLRDHSAADKPARVCASLAEAVEWAYAQSAAGDVVLLSPGCASYDWFRDFADRGEQFTDLVRRLPNAA